MIFHMSMTYKQMGHLADFYLVSTYLVHHCVLCPLSQVVQIDHSWRQRHAAISTPHFVETQVGQSQMARGSPSSLGMTSGMTIGGQVRATQEGGQFTATQDLGKTILL